MKKVIEYSVSPKDSDGKFCVRITKQSHVGDHFGIRMSSNFAVPGMPGFCLRSSWFPENALKDHNVVYVRGLDGKKHYNPMMFNTKELWTFKKMVAAYNAFEFADHTEKHLESPGCPMIEKDEDTFGPAPKQTVKWAIKNPKTGLYWSGWNDEDVVIWTDDLAKANLLGTRSFAREGVDKDANTGLIGCKVVRVVIEGTVKEG